MPLHIFKKKKDSLPEKNKEYFISLGAGTHQIPLILAAKKLGYSVIAVDKNMRAPGFDFSDLQVHCDLLRPYRIIRKLKEDLMIDNIAGVASRSFGMANFSAAVIAKEYGTPYTSPETIKRFRNKRAVKEFLAKNKILCPKIYSWKRKDQKDKLLESEGTLIARPAIDSHGKLGVSILRSRTDKERFLKKHPNDNGSYLVEKMVKGSEYTVLGYVEKGIYRNVCISDKIVSSKAPLFAELSHHFPSSATKELQESISQSIQKISELLMLDNTPIVAEFLLPIRGKKPYLVECNPEIGGEFLADYLIPAAFESDYFEKIISLSSLNKKRSQFPSSPKKSVVIQFIKQRTGILKELELPENLKNHPGFLFSKSLKTKGTHTKNTRGNLDRLAVFGISAPLGQAGKLIRESEDFTANTVVSYQ